MSRKLSIKPAGLKTEDKRHVTLTKCPRCSSVLCPSDKFCSQCSLVLDRQALDEIGEGKNVAGECGEKFRLINQLLTFSLFIHG